MLKDMPWYDSYLLIIEGKERAEQELEEALEPKLKNESVKRFFESIGADYTKNELVTAEINRASEEAYAGDITKQYRDEINLANALEGAVTRLDYDSIKKLTYFREDPQYGDLISQIMFYIGIKKIETDYSYITKAYNAIILKYPMHNLGAFISGGEKYYIQYWESVKVCVENEQSSPNFPTIRGMVSEGIMNYQLMARQYENYGAYRQFLDTSRALVDKVNALISRN